MDILKGSFYIGQSIDVNPLAVNEFLDIDTARMEHTTYPAMALLDVTVWQQIQKGISSLPTEEGASATTS
jgi:hypothetical protein